MADTKWEETDGIAVKWEKKQELNSKEKDDLIKNLDAQKERIETLLELDEEILQEIPRYRTEDSITEVLSDIRDNINIKLVELNAIKISKSK